jgi:Tol biopolymer transport system component
VVRPALLLIAAVLALALPAPAEATFPGRNGLLATSIEGAEPMPCGDMGYHQDCGPEWANVFTTTPTGKNRHRLTRCNAARPCRAGGATWSPDGRRIAYSQDGDVYVARADGSGRRVVARGAYAPAWSPDGRQLAFGSQRGIFRVRFPSEFVHRVTKGIDFAPDWSSTNVIAFRRTTDPAALHADIYTVRPDGKRLRRITTLGAESPSWSPDGRRIAFLRDSGIYVIGASGGRSRRVPLDHVVPYGAIWSPDGRTLAVTGILVDESSRGIAFVRPDGKEVRRTAGVSATSWQALPRR